MLMEHLELKGEKFSSFPLASDKDIDSMWEAVQAVDPFTEKDKSLTKKNLSSNSNSQLLWPTVVRVVITLSNRAYAFYWKTK